MSRPDTTYAYPDVYRMVLAECRECGRESAYCVLVVWRRPSGWSRPSMCCATCRVRWMTKWAVAAGWQVARVTKEPVMGREEWEAWKAANPPLEMEN